MLDNDGYNLDKLIKLLNIIKDNCDLESKKYDELENPAVGWDMLSVER